MDQVITVSNLSFRYKTRDLPTLKEISFRQPSSSCTLIQGASGSGKTTLCYCLKGIIPQVVEGEFTGSVETAGMDVCKYRIQTISKHVGLVLQDPEVQIVGRTVYEDLIFGPRNLLLSKAAILSNLPSALEALGLEGYEKKETYQLSGGEKQRLAIAGVLAMQPKVLILDEPSSELDPAGRKNLFDILLRLKRDQGLCITIVDQHLSPSHPLIDDLLYLKDGRLTASVETEEEPVARKCPANLSSNNKPTVLTVENLSFAYRPDTPVLKGINMEIRQQDFVALVGYNGSGKTTFAMHLNRLLTPQMGSVLFKNISINTWSRSKIARAIGFVFQNPDHQIFETSVEKEISYGLVQQKMDKEEIQAKVDEVLNFMNLEQYRDQHPATLPKGVRQFIAVASIIALSPEILIVDEPTTGLDLQGKEIIISKLKELNNRGTTVVMITHDMEIVEKHCSRLILLEEGMITVDKPVAKAFESKEYREFIRR